MNGLSPLTKRNVAAEIARAAMFVVAGFLAALRPRHTRCHSSGSEGDVGTVEAGDDLTIPGLVYGEEASVRLESDSITAPCRSYRFILCEVFLDPMTSVVCLGETFDLLIEETRTAVWFPDMTRE